jgi:hypothetical protein
VSALSHELRAERAVSEHLRARYHKLQTEAAARVDAERNNVAASVEKIVELQMKITAYEMAYGPLDGY